jgi:hypothetical protein
MLAGRMPARAGRMPALPGERGPAIVTEERLRLLQHFGQGQFVDLDGVVLE